MQNIKKTKNQIVIYQTKEGAIELVGDLKNENIWANQSEIASLFEVDQSVVSKHIKNIFKDKEVKRESNMQKMHIAKSDKPVNFYSLDVILSVGYRTNSKIAISFRQWATKTLREYITKGYVLNRKRISKNYNSFIQAVNTIQSVLPSETNFKVFSLIKEFADTWFSLEAYDKETLRVKGVSKKKVKITAQEIMSVISDLKLELIKTSQATEFFAKETKEKTIEGIVGNVMQTFNGRSVYKTTEEKAANLLYFMVKDHPFVDGIKDPGLLSLSGS